MSESILIGILYAVSANYWPAEDAPVLAAQIRQESAWQIKAESKFAQGLAQFTPGTRDWIWPKVGCDPEDKFDVECNFKAQAFYMNWLARRYSSAVSRREQFAFALAAYNGGAGWVDKEKKKSKTPDRWFGGVEEICIRAAWACRENRHYPRVILFKNLPLYQ